MKPATLLVAVLPLALAAPVANPEAAADVQAKPRDDYGTYTDYPTNYADYTDYPTDYGAYTDYPTSYGTYTGYKRAVSAFFAKLFNRA